MAKKSKSSEHGLGGFIDDRKNAATPLHVRVWAAILDELLEIGGDAYASLRFPARKRVPLNRPVLLRAFDSFNRGKRYRDQIKPFGFLQTVIAATEGSKSPRCIAPFENDTAKSRCLPWLDLHSGEAVELDWFGTYAAGTIAVQRLDEFAKLYCKHAEEKGSDLDGNPADSNYKGILGRLHIVSSTPTCIGKEIDRLSEDEDMNLEGEEPIRYESDDRDRSLEAALEMLKQLPRAEVAREVGISERRLRDIERRRVKRPHKDTRAAILWLADEVRTGRWVSGQEPRPKEGTSRHRREEEGGGSGWGIAIGLIFLIVLIIATFSNRNP